MKFTSTFDDEFVVTSMESRDRTIRFAGLHSKSTCLLGHLLTSDTSIAAFYALQDVL